MRGEQMTRSRTSVGASLAVFAIAASGLWAVGCASWQEAQPARQPFRSATLNAELTSAYPRSTELDPFGVGQLGDYPSQQSDDRVARAPDPDRGRRQMALGGRDDVYQPSDAAAYVTAVYALNETPTSERSGADVSIVDIYRYAQRNGTIYHSSRPAVGDLVFFHNTFDRNGDGRNNDWYTHVGLVESVDEDGTVSILSYMDDHVARAYLNLERADSDDERVNTTLRRRRPDDPPYTQYLASELFAGFGSLLGERTEFLVIDNWQPGMTVAQADPS